MKISLILLVAVPFVVSAGDMQLAANMKGLPEDFKRYFYNSEVVVQVYLNDNYIFDASISLRENGDIKLLRVIDEQPNSDPATNAGQLGTLDGFPRDAATDRAKRVYALQFRWVHRVPGLRRSDR